MEIIFILLFLALMVAGSFLIAFMWATKSGQFDDVDSPSVRILIDNDQAQEK